MNLVRRLISIHGLLLDAGSALGVVMRASGLVLVAPVPPSLDLEAPQLETSRASDKGHESCNLFATYVEWHL